ncbi:MAG: flagellar hook-basal body complex protein FliE [Pirellulales bacterium]|nr:flagellar hook-basal body complex protein FliE [Planctomycetales bacterium]
MNAIHTVGNLQPPLPPGPPAAAGNAPTDASFKNMLIESIQQVNSMQQQANAAVEGMATGAEVNPAEVLTAVQKADMAFRLTMQIRNKLVAAYQEVQNIRV